MTRDEAAIYQNELYDSVQRTLLPHLRRADTEPDNTELLQAIYEVWSRTMGALDAFMAMHGIPQNVRARTLEAELRVGKLMALAAHEQVCGECDGVQALRREMHQDDPETHLN